MSLVIHNLIRDVQDSKGVSVSKMTYRVAQKSKPLSRIIIESY